MRAGPREEERAEGDHLVEGFENRLAAPDQVAEVDELVARLQAGRQLVVQGGQLPGLPVHGGNGPNAAFALQNRELLTVMGGGCAGGLWH